MALIRVARTAKAVLEHVFYVGEDPTDSTTTVTVTLVDANGTTVTTGDATHASTGVYEFVLPAQASLKAMVASWTATIDGALVVEDDEVEIVGGFFFPLAEGRSADSSLASNLKYTRRDLEITRNEVEQECEEICAQAFVPRYRRVVLDGTGTRELLLPDPNIRRIIAVRVAPRVDGTFVALTSGQLAALVERDRVLHRTDSTYWTEGLANVIVEYEHGLNAPATDLVRAAKQRLRYRMNSEKTGVPDRAVSFQVADGGSYRLSQATAYTTGIPDIDAVYERYSLRPKSGPNGGSGAAGRSLNFDPQRYSLFHGGER